MQRGGGRGEALQPVLSLHPLGVMGWDLLIQRNQKSDWGIRGGGLEGKRERDPEVWVKSVP